MEETAQEAGDIFLSVLQNNGTTAQKNAVLANAGLAIQVIRPDRSLEACIAEARESIESGRAYQLLRKLLEVSA